MPDAPRKRFPPVFWLAVLFEFFERGAYYGMMSMLSVYFTDTLGFSKESVGVIKGVIQPIVYFMPIVAGALADRFGYRRALVVAFTFLGGGYWLTSQATDYTTVFLALCVMALGAGTFKPIISGTIARSTDASNSALGFGVFYWSINLGAFLFPLVLVPWLKNGLGPRWVMIAASAITGALVLPTLLFYREPPKPPSSKPKAGLLRTLADAFEIIYSPLVMLTGRARRSPGTMAVTILGASLVLGGGLLAWERTRGAFLLFVALLLVSATVLLLLRGDGAARPWVGLLIILAGWALLWLIPGLTLFARILSSVIHATLLALLAIDVGEQAAPRYRDHGRFLLMVCIYSGFWVVYFQLFDSVLWYVKSTVDAAPLNRVVNQALAAIGVTKTWRFDVEHVTVIDSGTIICLQLLISRLVKKTPALPTMIVGILLGSAGMATLSLSPHIGVFMLGLMIFSIGEMTAHPKFIAYVGEIAPPDRVGTYMGYTFLYGVIGSGIGAILGAKLYVRFVDQLHMPRTLWLIFAGVGLGTALGLLLFHRLLGTRAKAAG